MKLNRKKLHRELNRKKLHRELWLWLAENPTRTKLYWPGWRKYDVAENDYESYVNKCFPCGHACAWVFGCNGCPIDWGTRKCTGNGSIFEAWKHEEDLEKKSIHAEVIAFMWP